MQMVFKTQNTKVQGEKKMLLPPVTNLENQEINGSDISSIKSDEVDS
jgi:hypothetical protein